MMTGPFHVLITDRFAPEAAQLLRQDSRVVLRQAESPTPTSDELSWANALVIRSRTRIDAKLLQLAPELRLIITTTSGFDHIDLKAIQASRVFAAHTPDANATSAAELTWALILACTRKLLDAHHGVLRGDWNRQQYLGSELEGKTLGIIGLGRIGGRVARIGRAFGMRILAFDPYIDDDRLQECHAQRQSLYELLQSSDVISLHVPLTKKTKNLLSTPALEKISDHGILVNTSRGEVIDEPSLLRQLNQAKLAAVGLDVFAREPLPLEAELCKHPRVVLSPHIGATTSEAFLKASVAASQLVLRYLDSGQVENQLPPQAEWWQRDAGD